MGSICFRRACCAFEAHQLCPVEPIKLFSVQIILRALDESQSAFIAFYFEPGASQNRGTSAAYFTLKRRRNSRSLFCLIRAT